MDEKDFIDVTIFGYPWFMDKKGNFMSPGFKLKRKKLPKLTTMEAAAKAKEVGGSANSGATSLLMSSTILNVLMAGPL